MMQHADNNNRTGLERLQILVPACRNLDQPGASFAWLNGYCLLNFSLKDDQVTLSGEVRVGEHLAENMDLIARLANDLDPTAVLVGCDLTAMMRGLCKLPMGTPDQEPALALLIKLKTMLGDRQPIDLGQIESEPLDSLNPQVLAEMLTDQAEECLIAVTRPNLPEDRLVDMIGAWWTWRKNLVPILPVKEVDPTFDA